MLSTNRGTTRALAALLRPSFFFLDVRVCFLSCMGHETSEHRIFWTLICWTLALDAALSDNRLCSVMGLETR